MSENLLVIHGGGPTAVINASLYGVIEKAREKSGIGHIYGANNGTGGVLKEDFIELKNYTDEQLRLLLATPGTAIGTSRDCLLYTSVGNIAVSAHNFPNPLSHLWTGGIGFFLVDYPRNS